MNQANSIHAASFQQQVLNTLTLRNERLFLAAVFLSVVPLWIGRYLPMVDISQHAAQIAALREIWSGNPDFVQAFEINWFTPYLFGYFLLYLAALFVPVTAATQIVVSLSVISIPLLTGRLLRAAGADERWKWLAIPAGYSFAFYWGFISFMVAVPLGLLFLIIAMRFAQAPTWRNALVMAGFSIFLFFCHVIVLGFASLVAAGYIAGLYSNDLRRLALRLLPLATPVPLIVVWLVITYQSETVAQNAPTVYGPLLARFIELLVQPAGRDSLDSLIVPIVTASIIFLPMFAGSRLSQRPERWLPLALGIAAFFAVPAYVLNTGFFFQRLGIFLVPLWFMAWDAPDGPLNRIDRLALLVVVAWIFLNVGRFAAFAREASYFDKIAESMAPGRTTASMVVDNSSPLFAAPVYMHFPAWYQARQSGIVDFNFADFYSQPARYKGDVGPRLNEMLGWYPTRFQWSEHGGAKYDYFIVKSNFDVSNEIFKEKRSSVELVTRNGWWWLYRNLERNPER